MTNPFITERANYDLSVLEKEYRKRPENKWIQENLPPKKCVNSQVNSISSFSELEAFVGKFDLSLLTQLAAFKAMSVSPANFTDFLIYLDQTISYFSCIFSANLDTINNKSPSDKSFDWGAFALSIPFDFLKAYGIGLFKLLERIALEIIKKVFLEILDIVDCDKINKCIVPCDPNQNPYQKLFVKPLIKESKNVGIFFAQKIIDGKFSEKGFDITDVEMREYANKVITRLAPDELECLLKGFMSTSVVQFLIDLFKDHTGHDITDSTVTTIFDNISAVVDLVPYTPATIENNPCGLISMEAVARMRLHRQGYTEQEITDRINAVIQESEGRLEIITDFLRQLPNTPPDLDESLLYDENGNIVLDEDGNPQANGNSPIVSAVINTSLELIFNSVGYNQQAVQSILSRILVHHLGELCLAYYWTNWGPPGENAIPRSLPIDGFEGPDFPDETDSPSEDSEDNSVIVGDTNVPNPLSNSEFAALIVKINQQILKNDFDLISFVLDSISIGGAQRFYEKYRLDRAGQFGGYTIDYKQNGNISILTGDREKFSLRNNIFSDIDNDISITLNYNDIPVEYVQIVNRNDILNVLKTYNSEKLFGPVSNEIANEAERIFENIYENIFKYMDIPMAKEFFFQEFFLTEGSRFHKKDFSEIDYFQISQIINNIKEKINA